jgi:D-alanine-D-alanine ligase
VETYLPGREFTVGIIGTGEKSRPLGAMEVILLKGAESHGYSYFNKANYKGIVEYKPAQDKTAEEAIEIALGVWKGLGCRDCGRIDLRCDLAGTPNFLEANPLAGLNPITSDLPILCRFYGIEYEKLIEMIVKSAMERLT